MYIVLVGNDWGMGYDPGINIRIYNLMAGDGRRDIGDPPFSV